MYLLNFFCLFLLLFPCHCTLTHQLLTLRQHFFNLNGGLSRFNNVRLPSNFSCKHSLKTVNFLTQFTDNLSKLHKKITIRKGLSSLNFQLVLLLHLDEMLARHRLPSSKSHPPPPSPLPPPPRISSFPDTQEKGNVVAKCPVHKHHTGIPARVFAPVLI